MVLFFRLLFGGLAAYFFFDKLLLLPTALCVWLAFRFSNTSSPAPPPPDPAARPMINWFFLAVSIVCGWYGTSYFVYEPDWLWGGILQALSLGLLFKAVSPMAPLPENGSGEKPPVPAQAALPVPDSNRAHRKAGRAKTPATLKKKGPRGPAGFI